MTHEASGGGRSAEDIIRAAAEAQDKAQKAQEAAEKQAEYESKVRLASDAALREAKIGASGKAFKARGTLDKSLGQLAAMKADALAKKLPVTPELESGIETVRGQQDEAVAVQSEAELEIEKVQGGRFFGDLEIDPVTGQPVRDAEGHFRVVPDSGNTGLFEHLHDKATIEDNQRDEVKLRAKETKDANERFVDESLEKIEACRVAAIAAQEEVVAILRQDGGENLTITSTDKVSRTNRKIELLLEHLRELSNTERQLLNEAHDAWLLGSLKVKKAATVRADIVSNKQAAADLRAIQEKVVWKHNKALGDLHGALSFYTKAIIKYRDNVKNFSSDEKRAAHEKRPIYTEKIGGIIKRELPSAYSREGSENYLHLHDVDLKKLVEQFDIKWGGEPKS